MSKPIINGIDVSECNYFEEQHIEDMYESDDCNVCIDNFCALCWGKCEEHNGCYFKQFKRLQEENEELKEKAPMKLIAKNNKYRSALEEIREIVKEEQADIETVYTKRTYKRLNKIKNKIGEVFSNE